MVLPDDQLAALLLKGNFIDQDGIQKLTAFAQDTSISFTEALIEKNIITEENLTILISDYLKIPYVALAKLSIPAEMVHIVPERTARRKKVIAFARDTTSVKLAMADPTNKTVIEMIAKKTGLQVIPYIASEKDIENALYVYKKDLQKTVDELLQQSTSAAGILILEDVPVAKLVDLLIEQAYEDKTSDIHIEPREADSLIRFRIDGVLHDMLFVQKALHERIVSRIKVLSRLRTDEHLSAQDGKMRMKMNDDENLDIRVSILPIVDGEKIVMRLLTSHARGLSLIDLGMNEKDLAKLTKAFSRSFGMILSTGPTGSGKSTSIYSILKILNSREKNITTVEDPVEYRIKGVNQIQVNPKTNLTFANGLRSILRQDPNVVFVGEIRDSETAGIAINAALTGHLVLSTLHTNDAATALPRLIDMKVEPFLVASTVNLIMAQRLVRKICDNCKASITVQRSELEANIPQEFISAHFADKLEIRLYKGAGCKICHNTGYSGRIGVFEVFEVTPSIKKLITAKADSDVLVQQARSEGMATMLDDGLDKAAKGLTTIEEVLRVTKIETV